LAIAPMRVVLGSEWQESSEEWLIPTLICDSLTLLSGEPKTGKTALACHIIRALVTGQSIIDCQPTERDFRIGIMGFDSKWRREIQNRIPELMESVYFVDSINYKELDEWQLLFAEINRLGINYFVIDHLYGLGAGADLDRQHHFQEVQRPIQSLMNATGAGVLLIAHAPKGSDGRVAHSMASEGFARWLLRLKGSGKSRTLTALGNNGETVVRKMNLTPSTISLIESTKNSSALEVSDADGQLPARARFILANCPVEIRDNAKAIGKWLSSQDVGVRDPESGRTAVNNLLRGQLLKRLGPKGEITAGPKLAL
jgi:hypothetical protein